MWQPFVRKSSQNKKKLFPLSMLVCVASSFFFRIDNNVIHDENILKLVPPTQIREWFTIVIHIHVYDFITFILST